MKFSNFLKKKILMSRKGNWVSVYHGDELVASVQLPEKIIDFLTQDTKVQKMVRDAVDKKF